MREGGWLPTFPTVRAVFDCLIWPFSLAFGPRSAWSHCLARRSRTGRLRLPRCCPWRAPLLDLGVTGDRLDRVRATEIVADGAPLERAELDGAHVAECSVDRRLCRLCPLVFYVALIAQ